MTGPFKKGDDRHEINRFLTKSLAGFIETVVDEKVSQGMVQVFVILWNAVVLVGIKLLSEQNVLIF